MILISNELFFILRHSENPEVTEFFLRVGLLILRVFEIWKKNSELRKKIKSFSIHKIKSFEK